MKLVRILVAGIVGGVLMFMWGFVSHELTPIGEMGIRQFSPENEAAITADIQKAATERGAYFFPGMRIDKSAPKADQDAAQQAGFDKWNAGPRGVVIYDPELGLKGMTPLLINEGLSNIAAALFAATIVGCLSCGYLGRVFACVGIGLAAWLSIDVSYWNWYRFPFDMTLGSLLDQLGGWLVAGVGIAAIAGRCKPCTPPTPAG